MAHPVINRTSLCESLLRMPRGPTFCPVVWGLMNSTVLMLFVVPRYGTWRVYAVLIIIRERAPFSRQCFASMAALAVLPVPMLRSEADSEPEALPSV